MITGMGACGDKDEEPQFDIYENHEISACGLDDPLRNLDWLAEFTANYKDVAINVTIKLYANIETQEENIVMFHNRWRYIEGTKLLETMDPLYANQIYSCSGERLCVDNSGAVDSEKWGDFFYSGKNVLKEMIWYRYRIN